MNKFSTSALVAVAAFAALASTAARADGPDSFAQAPAFEGSRTRAEVKAEAYIAARTHVSEFDGARATVPAPSALNTAIVRKPAMQSARNLRQSQVTYPETSM